MLGLPFLSPMKHENLGKPLPDQTQYNESLQVYRDAIHQLAQRRALAFVDLYDLNDHSTEPLTDNGIHLTEAGYQFAARALSERLGIADQPPTITIDASSQQSNATNATVDEIIRLDDGVQFRAKLDSLPYTPSVAGQNPSIALKLKVHNLADGNYEIRADEHFLTIANAANLAAGVSILRGPNVEQAASLLETIRKKNELFFHRWRPQNETYLLLFRKHEQGNNAVELPKFDPLVAEQEALIATLRAPKTRSYTVKLK